MPDTSIVKNLSEEMLDRVGLTIADPTLRRVYSYWRARVVDGRLPSRRDIDPLELPYVMGNVILVDVERTPLRFRYRLAGSNITHRMGFDPTGHYVDQHPDPTMRERIRRNYLDVERSGLPKPFARDEIVDGRVRRYDALMLPLSNDGVTVSMIAVVMKFRD